MRQGEKWFKSIQSWVMRLNAVILILIMSIVFIQTVTRYVVFYSIPGSVK